jgi:hypothetical protein
MLRFLVVVSSLWVLVACPKSSSPADAGPAIDADRTQAADDLKPLYDGNTPPVAVATSWCDALHDLPARKKRGCCEPAVDGGVAAPADRSSIAATCAGQLSAALAKKDVVVDDAKVQACVAARETQLDGCAWVGVLAPPLPQECAGLMTGSLDEGARCSSSLACKPGLHCHGASALDAGRCGKPAPPGARCGAGVDALAVVVPQAEIDRGHRECEGACVLGKCQAAKAAGDACRSDAECGDGNRCDGTCVTGRIAVGAPCTKGGCVAGARCVDGACAPLATAGAACRVDFDCAQGGCVNGACAMKCTSWRDVQTR